MGSTETTNLAVVQQKLEAIHKDVRHLSGQMEQRPGGVFHRIEMLETRHAQLHERQLGCPARNRNWITLIGVALSGIASLAAVAGVIIMIVRSDAF